MDIGGKIKSLREDKGINQVDLAAAVGVTPGMICQIERGSKVPTLPLSVNIAEVLECSLDDLVGRNDTVKAS